MLLLSGNLVDSCISTFRLFIPVDADFGLNSKLCCIVQTYFIAFVHICISTNNGLGLQVLQTLFSTIPIDRYYNTTNNAYIFYNNTHITE